MKSELQQEFENNNVQLQNLQLLEIVFPNSYAQAISDTQNEKIAKDEAVNNQSKQNTIYEG